MPVERFLIDFIGVPEDRVEEYAVAFIGDDFDDDDDDDDAATTNATQNSLIDNTVKKTAARLSKAKRKTATAKSD